MLRILHFLCIVCLIFAAVAVYKVKYESTYEAQRVAKLREDIRVERDRLATLRAEWTRLSSPERIQKLASRHLGMKPLQVSRIGDFSNLPEKQPGFGADTIGEFIGALPAPAEPRDPLGDFLRALNEEQAGRRGTE